MKLFVLIFLVLINFSISAQKFPYDQLKKNLIYSYLLKSSKIGDLRIKASELESDNNSPDQVMSELFQKSLPNIKQAQTLIDSINRDGSWNNINYEDQKKSGWEPKKHAEYILFLTKIYVDKESSLFRNPKLSKTIHLALDFWFNKKPVCSNWWYNEIGVPKTLGPVFLMLADELSKDEIKKAVEVLDHSQFKMTGQNKVWLAGNIFMKALLIKDEKLAIAAHDTILSEIANTKTEGIKSDYSFHQHGPQQQFGNYGLAYVNSLCFWSIVFSNSALQINQHQKEILRNLLIHGYLWINWKGYLDVNSLGRQFYKDVQRTKTLALAFSMVDMSEIDPENKQTYTNFITQNYRLKKKNEFTGNKHFWQSDMTVHRASAWFCSIKMSSERVIGAEAGNGDNLKGYYLADGATYIMVDGNEYENIFPIWDWRKLPGVTCYQTSKPLIPLTFGGYRNQSDFAGGLSDGQKGITSLFLKRDSLSAKKSWFFFDNLMVCLGTNIKSEKEFEVGTSINQCHLKNEVVFWDGKKNILKQDSLLSSQTINRVFHNQIGYFFLQPTDIKLSTKKQTGDWHDIMAGYASRIETSNVFSLEISHGRKPKNEGYAYAILPAISSKIIENYTPNFTVFRNDSICQAIVSKDLKMIMIVAFKASNLEISKSMDLKINQAGLYLLENKNGKWNLSIADPSHKLIEASIEFLNKKYVYYLPKNELAGKTITEIL